MDVMPGTGNLVWLLDPTRSFDVLLTDAPENETDLELAEWNVGFGMTIVRLD